MSLVGPGEIAAYVQKEDWYKLVGIGLFNEPARFVHPKPYILSEVPDDSWAALILRVDPLARKILDPRRSYIGTLILFIIIATVFSTIRPTVKMSDLYSYDDAYIERYDDFYLYERDDDSLDDVLIAEIQYRKKEIASDLKAWKVSYSIVVLFILTIMIVIALLMERINKSYDDKIRDVCDEIGARFQSFGITVEYRTHHILNNYRRFLIQERAIVFKRSETKQENGYMPAEITAPENTIFPTSSIPSPMMGKFEIDRHYDKTNFSASYSGESGAWPYPNSSEDISG